MPEIDQKENLIRAAIETIGERGFEQATVSEIVKKAGVAQGTFYLYFDHKRDILKALAKKVKDEVEKKLETEIVDSDPPIEKIHKSLKSAFVIYKKYEKIAAPLYSGAAYLEFHRYSKNIGQAFVDRLTSWVLEGEENGDFDVSDTELTARFIISLFERVVYGCLLSTYPYNFEEIFPHLVRFIDQALGCPQ